MRLLRNYNKGCRGYRTDEQKKIGLTSAKPVLDNCCNPNCPTDGEEDVGEEDDNGGDRWQRMTMVHHVFHCADYSWRCLSHGRGYTKSQKVAATSKGRGAREGNRAGQGRAQQAEVRAEQVGAGQGKNRAGQAQGRARTRKGRAKHTRGFTLQACTFLILVAQLLLAICLPTLQKRTPWSEQHHCLLAGIVLSLVLNTCTACC